MKKIQVAVLGVSSPTKEEYKLAEDVGRELAGRGWLLINGGLSGVMEASSKGASEAGGTVVGIIPTKNRADANDYVAISIATNMGHARNPIIVQSADACIAIGKGYGTLSEIAIALKEGRLVVSLKSWEIDGVVKVDTAEDAASTIQKQLGV
jgi:hypothetical protein